MNHVKERLIGAITVMDDDHAQRLWNIISSNSDYALDNMVDVEVTIPEYMNDLIDEYNLTDCDLSKILYDALIKYVRLDVPEEYL